MAERLAVPETERIVVGSDQLPKSLSEYGGIEKVVDEHGTRYFPLKRGRQLSAETVESAFEAEGRVIEDVITPSTDLEQLRQQFEDYKRETEERIRSFENQLSEAENERDLLVEENIQLKEELDLPEPRDGENRFERGWNRVTGRLGTLILGTQLRAVRGNYVYVNRDGRDVVVREEVVDGYPKSERRAGAVAVVGGVALLAAGIAIGWLANRGLANGDEHTTVTETVRGTTTETVDPSGVVTEAPGPYDSGDVSPGLHRDYTNSFNNGFAVDLPRGYDLVGTKGNYDIVGPTGNVIIDNVEWDRQGNLAEWVRDELRRKGFSLRQDTMTYLDQTGPGRHGIIQHYVTAVRR